jgi:hypothetical protein
MQSHGSRFVRDMERLGATDAWDFVNQSYLRAGRVTAPGITFTRASVGSYLNNNNTMTVFSSGQPRIGDKGILIEGSRQNLFLNSAVGETQSITVTAAAHTLSFFGTGTVTLSGVSTAGPLVGTGEFNRVSLTFTPTAGSLTLTVSGDIKWVNLELGSFPTSWIPSEGTAVTRAADAARASLASTSYPLTLYSEALVPAATGAAIVWASTTSALASNADRLTLFLDSSASPQADVISNSAAQAGMRPVATGTAGVVHKFAARAATNDSRAAFNTTLSAQDTSVTLPAAATFMYFGQRPDAALFAFSYLRRVALILPPLTDAQLQEITT